MLKRFKEEVKAIKENNLSHEDVEKYLSDYWVTPDIVLETGEVINPLHYRSYYMGNEIFGTIYDNFGLKTLFDVLDDPNDILDKFLSSIKSK